MREVDDEVRGLRAAFEAKAKRQQSRFRRAYADCLEEAVVEQQERVHAAFLVLYFWNAGHAWGYRLRKVHLAHRCCTA